MKRNKPGSGFVLSRSSNPYLLMVYIGMIGSAILFLFLTVVYVSMSKRVNWNALPVPIYFFASTFMVGCVSLGLQISKTYFKAEEFKSYARWMFVSFVFAGLFVLMQLLGWHEWGHKGFVMSQSNQKALIYLLSGLHLLHILVGMGLMAWVLKDALKNTSYIEGYIASLNPKKKSLMNGMIVYWHFVDGLWIWLFLFFLLV